MRVFKPSKTFHKSNNGKHDRFSSEEQIFFGRRRQALLPILLPPTALTLRYVALQPILEVIRSNSAPALTVPPGNPMPPSRIPSPAGGATIFPILGSQAPTPTAASQPVARTPSQQSIPGLNPTQPLRARFGVPRDRLPGNRSSSSSQCRPESSPPARRNEQGSS
ncbi:hypothetical protein IFR05_009478 [Cadophora sp. M221]|nr:hypothetical protein IFR05_009478 [Cadophora sp. M221]